MKKNSLTDPRIAILIPCLNEAKTITQVVQSFKTELPQAQIYVGDNGSEDDTVAQALQAGAIVTVNHHRGKGNVVRSMFIDIDAEIYVMVDGDATYAASDVHALLDSVMKGNADMVVGDRLARADGESLTVLHQFGNRFFVIILNTLFNGHFRDILSGFRVMNREFVKNVPLIAREFEVEAEMTIHALEKGYIVKEVPIEYHERPEGSVSKLRSFRDGYKILWTIFSILRDHRPMKFFTFIALLFFVPGIMGGGIVIYEFLLTGLVLRIPTALLSVSLVVIGFFIVLTGVTINTMKRRFQEVDELIKKRLAD